MTMKENYDNLPTILNEVKYEQCQWDIYGNLKTIGILLGLQEGFTYIVVFCDCGRV